MFRKKIKKKQNHILFVVAYNGSWCVRKDILSVLNLSVKSMRTVWNGFECQSN